MRDAPMEPMDAFESRLVADLRAITEPALRRLDAVELATTLAASGTRQGARRIGAVPTRWVLAVLLLALALTVASLVGGAAGLGPFTRELHPGLLAYVRGFDPMEMTHGSLMFADPDGSNARVVLDGVDGATAWSPSGRYVMTESWAVDLDTMVHVVDADGLEVGVIDAGENADASWSPIDDVLLTVTQDPDDRAHLRLWRPDGSLLRALATPDGVTTIVDGVSWSPDGRRIVVAGCIACNDDKYDDTPAQVRHLWLVEADGPGWTQLTDAPDRFEVDPRWSPDGRTILFWENCAVDATCPDIDAVTMAMSPDGSGRHVALHGYQPRWSPDGSRIVFTRSTGAIIQLVVADPDGANEVALTAPTGQDQPLWWSKDGKRVFYAHYGPVDPTGTGGDTPETWIVDADGRHPTMVGAGFADLDQQFTR